MTPSENRDKIGQDIETNKELAEFLMTFITPERKQKFLDHIRYRTRYIAIALEDIYQPHNASAVLRTCDCFGIQDVHIIENRNKYEVNPDVALGSSKWLNLFTYNQHENNTTPCLKSLKEKGYRIIATTPHRDDFIPETLPIDQKFVLLFGTELAGLTPEAIKLADGYVRIPMQGFTESLNISVSAAIFIHTLTQRLRESTIPWRLSEEEQTHILIEWTRQTVKTSDALMREFLRKRNR